MHFAIYGRKSVYSDKSDSISNQIRMCREYIDFKFPGKSESVTEYTDEGLTGANTNRPQLKAMLKDISDGLLDVLVVYQLDRLSRDVRDFANIYAALEERHVMFVSIKENIDTATPIGKAMMYVTMVFAQMERETIAARVTDNMMGLARRGLWTGGTTPAGYTSERIEIGGKKHVALVPDPEGAEWVRWLFDTFLENHYSLSRMVTAFSKQGITAPGGGFFASGQLHRILTMPYCVEATPEVYDYFAGLGCKIDPGSPREAWDGKHGVMTYGRHTVNSKKVSVQPKEEWTVCIGIHEPIIPADKWLAVQERLRSNTFNKKQKYDTPLLKGVLRCAKCGCLMKVDRKKTKKGVSSSYSCTSRAIYGKERCDMSQIVCRRLDEKALDIFRKIDADPDSIMQYVCEPEHELKLEWRDFASEIAPYKAKIARLTAFLSEVEESSAAKHIVAQIEELDANIEALKREEALQEVEKRRMVSAEQGAEQKAAEVQKLVRGMSGFTSAERNEIIRGVVREMTWDGETLFLRL